VKVLLDEMLPVGVADLLPDDTVITVKVAGFTGLKNGELIRQTIAAGFEVLVTADRNLPAQQNIPRPGSRSCSCPATGLPRSPSARQRSGQRSTARPER